MRLSCPQAQLVGLMALTAAESLHDPLNKQGRFAAQFQSQAQCPCSNGANLENVVQQVTGDTIGSISLFFLAQILILVVLLPISGIHAYVRKMLSPKSIVA